jgi:hypothetical protein
MSGDCGQMKVIFGIEIKKPALQPVFVVFVSGGVPYMKLHHLLQKCSFFLIKLAAFQASGAARMKLHEIVYLYR